MPYAVLFESSRRSENSEVKLLLTSIFRHSRNRENSLSVGFGLKLTSCLLKDSCGKLATLYQMLAETYASIMKYSRNRVPVKEHKKKEVNGKN